MSLSDLGGQDGKGMTMAVGCGQTPDIDFNCTV